MKLKEVEIANYKCIRKPCLLQVADITCLVGKNESGKTALLEALYRLNPIIEHHGSFNVDNDYPRMDIEDYRLDVADGKKQPAVVVKATFLLEKDDTKQLEKDFPGVLAKPELILAKDYQNELYAELTINEEAAVDTFLKKAGLSPQQLKSIAKSSTLEELANLLQQYEQDEAVGKLLAKLADIRSVGFLRYLYDRYLQNKVPKFLYFDEFYQMKGHVNIQALIERQQAGKLLDSDYPLLGLIDLARLNLQEISNPQRALERDNRLEGASNHLTRSIMKYWSQNRYLEMRFDIRPALPDDPEGMRTGTNLWAHVYNSKQKASTLLGRRSKGFVWFFSFLAWFSQQKQKNTALILLLDEPSMHLHGIAQKDLLRYLEDEKEAHQVIYSAQSPYMVDAEHFDRVRIVEDKSMETAEPLPYSNEGTQIDTNVLSAAQESILILQGALGYKIARSLSQQSSNLLVVEAAADLLYLQSMSELLHQEGREGLNAKWQITPLGGAKMLPVFVALMGYHNGPNIAGLFSNGEQLNSINDLFAKNLLLKENIYSFSDFTGATEADIEDMFDIDFYLGLVNAAYQTILNKPLTKGSLRGKSLRICALIESCFEALPLQNNARFSRFRPAQYFALHGIEQAENISKDTLGRFERAFNAINSSIK